MKELLCIKNLRTSFKIDSNFYPAVDGISLSLNKNEIFAIVGESGSGKSALALSLTRLHNPHYTRISGDVFFKGQNLLTLSETELNKIRGREIGMIFQDSIAALNPLMKVGPQIEESLFYHTNASPAERKAKTITLLEEVGIPNPVLIYSRLPHQLSGGMRQRVMIAVAMACRPSLIIADEPTTALDVTIQATILELLQKLQQEISASIMLITHDLGVVAEIAQRAAVMYAGQIVELATVDELFSTPKHPYTRALLASVPRGGGRLHTIEGSVPTLQKMQEQGCRFAPRIPNIPREAHEENPQFHQISSTHQVLCTCHSVFD